MNERPRSFASAVVPAILFAALIFWVSSLSQPNAPDFGLEWGDKINHAGAFGLMALLWYRASGWLIPGGTRSRRLVLTVLFVALYGAGDEIHQSYVPGRFADITDWIADVGGALLAAILLARLNPSSTIYDRLFIATTSAPKADRQS